MPILALYHLFSRLNQSLYLSDPYFSQLQKKKAGLCDFRGPVFDSNGRFL